MYRVENQCVDCGLPCLGSSCPYRNVGVVYCDQCGNEGAGYRIDGEDFCEECAKGYIEDTLNDMSLIEQGEALGIDIESTEDVYS